MVEQTEMFLEDFKETMKKVDYPKIKRLLLFADGIILKNSKNFRERVRAEILFDQLLLEDLGYHIDIEILFNQCDLLLNEIKVEGDENLLTKLQGNIDRLVEISTKYNLVELRIESLWLKAQLSLLKGDFKSSEELLEQAQIFAEEKGYRILSLKIISTKEEILEFKEELARKEFRELSIKEKLKNLNVEEGFQSVKETQVFDLFDSKFKFDI